MIAIATSLAMIRNLTTDWFVENHTVRHFFSEKIYYEVIFHIDPVLIGVTPALLAIRLRRPRPPAILMASHPGAVALAVISGCILIHALLWAMYTVLNGYSWASFLWLREVEKLSKTVGQFVAAAWFVQAWGGNWRPVSSWIDRAGRVTGGLWICIILAHVWLRDL